MTYLHGRPAGVIARLVPCVVVLVLAGCGPATSGDGANAPTPPSTPPSTPQSTPAAVAPTRPALPISQETLAAVCSAEPCGGDEALVELLRDAQGQVRRLHREYGACAHSPGIYFDETGRQTEIIPMQPVVVGSPEQLAFAVRIDAQTNRLTSRGEKIRCSDGLLLICTEGHGCTVAPHP